MIGRPASTRPPWWTRLLCCINCHDWRHMNGICTVCGLHDPLWWDGSTSIVKQRECS